MAEERTMEREVTVKLTTEEIAERAETMAGKMLHVEALQAKKKADGKSTQALIDAEL